MSDWLLRNIFNINIDVQSFKYNLSYRKHYYLNKFNTGKYKKKMYVTRPNMIETDQIALY